MPSPNARELRTSCRLMLEFTQPVHVFCKLASCQNGRESGKQKETLPMLFGTDVAGCSRVARHSFEEAYYSTELV